MPVFWMIPRVSLERKNFTEGRMILSHVREEISENAEYLFVREVHQ